MMRAQRPKNNIHSKAATPSFRANWESTFGHGPGKFTWRGLVVGLIVLFFVVAGSVALLMACRGFEP